MWVDGLHDPGSFTKYFTPPGVTPTLLAATTLSSATTASGKAAAATPPAVCSANVRREVAPLGCSSAAAARHGPRVAQSKSEVALPTKREEQTEGFGVFLPD